VHSIHIPKNVKALTIEPGTRKGKKLAICISSYSSDAFSYTIKSLPLKSDDQVRKITFGDMHPKVSTNEVRKPAKAYLQIHMVVSSEGSEKRRTTSHQKYNF
jgi:hypothetical protein